MKLGLRLLFGFFLIAGIAAFFGLRVFVLEVRPSVREVMEDMLVDTANILAELAHDDLAALGPGQTLAGSGFAANVNRYAQRPIDVKIWGLAKTSLDLRVYVTDAKGRVVFDAGPGAATPALGADYSQWRDVALTLTGRYGARASREVLTDERSAVMYVAAPVMHQGQVIGVLTVAKPLSTVMPFVARAERKMLVQSLWLLGLSLLVGVAVTVWTVWQVRRLRQYAQQVQFGERRQPPQLSGELGELAQAMGAMRDRLDGREHLEQTVRALTHELKSPMAAIAGAAELLEADLPRADRQAFALQIQDQVQRQRGLVERLLALSKLELRRQLDHSQPVDLLACADAAVAQAQALAQQRGVAITWQGREPLQVMGEADWLVVAVGNLLDNALDFSPAGSVVELCLSREGQQACLSLRDHGPGVPVFALAKLGQRFYSTPRPAPAGQVPRRGSGLGLAIVREVMAQHGGQLVLQHAQPGLLACLKLPLGVGVQR